MKEFEFLPHTTDAYVAAFGRTIEQAYENAAKAMFHLMTDLQTVNPKESEELTVTGFDHLSLLYNWLEQLLVTFEVEGKIFSRFHVKIVEEERGLRLSAEVAGELFDKNRHPSKVEVKAVTYHKMEVLKEDSIYRARFILDL